MPSSKRIIRGAEAEAFQSWSVDMLGKHYDSRVDRLLSELSHHQGQQFTSKPKLSEAELRLLEWEDRLQQREAQLGALEEQTRTHAHAQGLQQGYDQGWEAASAERKALLQATESLQQEFETFKQHLAEKLLDLAVAVSKKVVADTLQVHPENAALLLEQFIETLALEGASVTLKLHPRTAQLLESQFGDRKILGGLRLLEDPSQIPGGFILHHPEGEADATIQTRWLRAIEALGRNEKLNQDELNKMQTPQDETPDAGELE